MHRTLSVQLLSMKLSDETLDLEVTSYIWRIYSSLVHIGISIAGVDRVMVSEMC